MWYRKYYDHHSDVKLKIERKSIDTSIHFLQLSCHLILESPHLEKCELIILRYLYEKCPDQITIKEFSGSSRPLVIY